MLFGMKCRMTIITFTILRIWQSTLKMVDVVIRPFIDLLILDGIQGADIEKRDKLLWHGNLLKFANVARKLSRIWFSNEPYDFISQQMEDYILRGGVYGNNENRITVQQQKKGGRIKYALLKIFIPYDVIKFHYPILQKHRCLTPFMEVR